MLQVLLWISIGRTDAEAEGSILWPPDSNTISLEKTLMLGKIEGGRRRGQQRMRWLDGIINSIYVSLSNSRRWWRTGKPGMMQSRGSQRVGHNWVTDQQHLLWYPNQTKTIQKSTIQIFHVHEHKNLQNISKSNLAIYTSNAWWSSWIFQGLGTWFNIWESISVIYQTKI